MPKNYYGFLSAAHLLLINDGKVLLARRFNTGYEDGNYSVPSGHVEGDETATNALIREVKEETNIDLDPANVRMVHIMHRKAENVRLDLFFEAKEWTGELKILEPNKCDELRWFPMDQLPDNTIPYIRSAIENYLNKSWYSEFGWNKV